MGNLTSDRKSNLTTTDNNNDKHNTSSHSLSRSFYLQNLDMMRGSYNHNPFEKKEDEKTVARNNRTMSNEEYLLKSISLSNLLVNFIVSSQKVNIENKKMPIKNVLLNSLYKPILGKIRVGNKDFNKSHSHENIFDIDNWNDNDNNNDEVDLSYENSIVFKKKTIDNKNKQNQIKSKTGHIQEKSHMTMSQSDKGDYFMPYSNESKEDPLINIKIDLRQILIEEGIDD